MNKRLSKNRKLTVFYVPTLSIFTDNIKQHLFAKRLNSAAFLPTGDPKRFFGDQNLLFLTAYSYENHGSAGKIEEKLIYIL